MADRTTGGLLIDVLIVTAGSIVCYALIQKSFNHQFYEYWSEFGDDDQNDNQQSVVDDYGNPAYYQQTDIVAFDANGEDEIFPEDMLLQLPNNEYHSAGNIGNYNDGVIGNPNKQWGQLDPASAAFYRNVFL